MPNSKQIKYVFAFSYRSRTVPFLFHLSVTAFWTQTGSPTFNDGKVTKAERLQCFSTELILFDVR